MYRPVHAKSSTNLGGAGSRGTATVGPVVVDSARGVVSFEEHAAAGTITVTKTASTPRLATVASSEGNVRAVGRVTGTLRSCVLPLFVEHRPAEVGGGEIGEQCVLGLHGLGAGFLILWP